MMLRPSLAHTRTAASPPCIGKVVRATRTTIYARLPHAAIGDLCLIHGSSTTRAQVIAFHGDVVALAPFEHIRGIALGASVENKGGALTIDSEAISPGAILDPFGVPLAPNSHAPIPPRGYAPLTLELDPPLPLERSPIRTPFQTGIRALDSLLPIGYGQRLGIFAPPGVGKSTLLGALARSADVDITVVGLIGERGREVGEFIEESLGPEGLRRAILVVATGDEAPLRRVVAPRTATRIAEHYRAHGKRVLLLIDSLTRYARALRDLGLAAGEPPLAQGLTPSLYVELPRLLERAGTGSTGSITALYTVLTSESDEGDLLAEEVKSLLDGHIVLSTKVRALGYQPPIDPTCSVSRLAGRLLTPSELADSHLIVDAIHRLLHDRDIVTFGGAPPPALARALRFEGEILSFMSQKRGDKTSMEESRTATRRLAHLLRSDAAV